MSVCVDVTTRTAGERGFHSLQMGSHAVLQNSTARRWKQMLYATANADCLTSEPE